MCSSTYAAGGGNPSRTGTPASRPFGPRSADANVSPSSPTSASASSNGVSPAYTELPRHPSGKRLPSSPAHATTSSARRGRSPDAAIRRKRFEAADTPYAPSYAPPFFTVSRCEPHCTGAPSAAAVEPREHVAGAVLLDVQAVLARPAHEPLARRALARR